MRHTHVAAYLLAGCAHTVLNSFIYFGCEVFRPAASAELMSAFKMNLLILRIINSLLKIGIADNTVASIILGKTCTYFCLFGHWKTVDLFLVKLDACFVGDFHFVVVPLLLCLLDIPMEVSHQENGFVVVETNSFLELRNFIWDHFIQDVIHCEENEVFII